MPIQKNNFCRMGGLEKGQWVTIILIRASTGVCENHNNLLPSEILPRSYLQTLGNLFLSSSSPGSKEKNTNLLDQGDRTSLLLQSNAVASAIAFHHVDVMKSLVKQINNKMKLFNYPRGKTKELYTHRIKNKRLYILF